MVQVGLMVEGQNDLTWERWQRMLQAAEDLGYPFIFRSDHLSNPQPPNVPALDLWASLAYAASHTSRVEFGPLVSSITFRLPAITAWSALAVENLSGGRLVLGLGAGWQEREHRMFGIPFPATNVRFEMLEEYLQVITLLLRSTGPQSFGGKHFRLDDAVLLPHSPRAAGPPILVGGNGMTRTLPLAARYADEWNGNFISAEGYRERNRRLDALLDEIERPPDSVRRSVMLGTIFARDDADLRRKLEARQMTAEQAMSAGHVVGTAEMWPEQLSSYAKAGAERIMLQWLDLDDLEGLETIAREVLPAL